MKPTRIYRNVNCPRGIAGLGERVYTDVCNACPLIGDSGDPVTPKTKDCLGIELKNDHPKR